MLFGECLQGLRHHASLAAHQSVGRFKAENAVHPVERDHHLAQACYRATRQTGATAGRYQGKPVRVRELGNGDDLVNGFGEYDGRWCNLVAARPVAAPNCQIVGRGLDARGREDTV